MVDTNKAATMLQEQLRLSTNTDEIVNATVGDLVLHLLAKADHVSARDVVTEAKRRAAAQVELNGANKIDVLRMRYEAVISRLDLKTGGNDPG